MGRGGWKAGRRGRVAVGNGSKGREIVDIEQGKGPAGGREGERKGYDYK